jgi:hypothetical protein
VRADAGAAEREAKSMTAKLLLKKRKGGAAPSFGSHPPSFDPPPSLETFGHGTKQTATRLPIGLVAELDAYAKRRQANRWERYTRADAIRDLITAGLAAERINVSEAKAARGRK